MYGKYHKLLYNVHKICITLDLDTIIDVDSIFGLKGRILCPTLSLIYVLKWTMDTTAINYVLI